MHHFPCSHCTLSMTVSEDVGEPVVCPNCNTRQLVPSHAIPMTPEEERHLLSGKLPPPPPPLAPVLSPAAPALRAPSYPLVLVAGYLMMLTGAIAAVGGLIWLVDFQGGSSQMLVAFQWLVTGIITMGLGQLFHAIRDIAQHSWLQRKTIP